MKNEKETTNYVELEIIRNLKILITIMILLVLLRQNQLTYLYIYIYIYKHILMFFLIKVTKNV